MTKAKEISIINITVLFILSFAISAVYLATRPYPVPTRSVPVFVGEEVVVQKAVKALTTTRAERATMVEKAEITPMPTPKVAVPLPIIPPSVTFKILPTYPATALEKGLEGKVLLSVYLGLSGLPEKIEKKISSGISELDQAAVAAISQWKFAPASQGGQTIGSWFEVPISFKIEP